VIDNIWQRYDTDGNGSLDLDEARFFVKDILKGLGDDDENLFSEKVYLAMFKSFDEDMSGTLEKEELHGFIKKLIDVDDQGAS
jgi:Ca2+-binding EF-hand superfamily protein